MTNIGLYIKPEYLCMKRTFDLVVSVLALIVLSPLFVIVAIAILIDSGAPIFYTQTRVGKRRKPFRLIKFRTMVKNADKLKSKMYSQNEAAFPYFKIRNDSRITKVGKFLRRTSIDELPQLFNIIKGDMSIVGCRPVLPQEASYLKDIRFEVDAGLTGITQIHRNENLALDEIERLEAEYVNSTKRMWLDLCIIFKTFKVVFKGQ